jgi:hypothetical protein
MSAIDSTAKGLGLGEATGGYKGYGYAMVVELLSAVLQDGNYGKALEYMRKAYTLMTGFLPQGHPTLETFRHNIEEVESMLEQN